MWTQLLLVYKETQQDKKENGVRRADFDNQKAG